MKRCRDCGAEKPVEEFYKDSARRDGRTAACKTCELERRHAWYQANRERAIATARAWQERNPERYRATQERYRQVRRSEQRTYHLRRTFGLTLDEYDALLAAQDGECAICGNPPQDGQFLHVDHNHETGDIRGLLCVRCNNALGQLREDVAVAQRAVEYLEANGFAFSGVYELSADTLARARSLVTTPG